MKIYTKKLFKIYVFILFILVVMLGGVYKTYASSLPLKGHSFYIDPGHGGADPGTLYKDIYEKNINLDISLKLKKSLEKYGAKVYMTRYGDYDMSYINSRKRKLSDLNNRVKMINDSNVDMYISIHLNSINSSTWHGAQVFYDDVNSKNKALAILFQKRFNKYLNSDRNISELKTMLLNRKVTVPGILIEAGFLSNPNDRYLLQQTYYQNKIAENITAVLIDLYN